MFVYATWGVVYYVYIILYAYLFVCYTDTLNVSRTGYTIIYDRTDISWKSDRDTRFQNNNGNTTIPESDNVQPKNWQRNIMELDNALQNEDLIVWFRVSAFPNFIKLYARLYVSGRDILPAGQYSLNVNYSILSTYIIYVSIVFKHT